MAVETSLVWQDVWVCARKKDQWLDLFQQEHATSHLR